MNKAAVCPLSFSIHSNSGTSYALAIFHITAHRIESKSPLASGTKTLRRERRRS